MSVMITRVVWFVVLLAFVVGISGAVVGCGEPTTTENPQGESMAESTPDGASSPDDAPDGTNTPDAASEPSTDEPPKEVSPEPVACDFATPQGPFKVSQGGRFFLSTETEPPGGSVAFPVLPGSWLSVADAEKKQLLVRTDYKDPQKHILAVDLTCGTTTTRKRIEVEVTALQWASLPAWKAGETGPDKREHPRIWIDPKAPDTLWLWGGLLFFPRQFTPTYDMWKLDIPSGKWTEIKDVKDTPQLTTAQVALQPGQSSALVYGGSDPQNNNPDALYQLSFDGTTPVWKELTGDGWGPNASTLSAWFYDPVHKRFVSACGIQRKAGYDVHCRVSTYDPAAEAGKRWTEWTIDGPKPTGRYGFAYAYDKEDQRLIVFSGAQEPVSQSDPVNAAQDTWALELKDKQPRWTKLEPKGVQIPGRRNGCWALDPVGHRLFMFGGTADARSTVPSLYALHLDKDNPRWHKVSLVNGPPIRSSCIGIYDEARKQILFGFGNSRAAYADFHALKLE